ncbi:MAG: hypothetical protein AAF957_07910 [Planctomycetota bacterium]
MKPLSIDPSLVPPLVLGALATLAAPSALAQAPTVLLRQGDTVDVEGQPQTVTQIRHSATSACDGHACSARTTGPLGAIDLVWGALRGGAPELLRAETTADGLLQTSYDGFFELSADGVAHAAISQDVVTAQTGIHAAWLDGDAVARTGTPAPGGKFWRTIEDVGATLDGRRWFRASLADAPGGSVSQRGLFVEDDFGNIVPVVLTGETYPNFPAELAQGAVAPTARFSSLRGRWIAPVWLNTNSSTSGAMIADSQGLVLGGTLVQEFSLIPPSVGGLGDRWDNFSWCGINEAGEWFFCGDTFGVPSTQDDFICRNDGIWRRAGDEVDGETIVGEVVAAGLNGSGELAYVWSIEGPGGSAIEALFREDELIARAGDAVDWDGDGALDPSATLVDFHEGTLSIASSGDVFIVARVDAGAGPRDAYVRFPRRIGTRYCAASTNFSGGPASISAHGSLDVVANDLTLRCSAMPQQSFGFFLASQTQGFAAQPGGSAGNLCLGGSIGRFQMSILNSGLGAVIELQIDLTAIPQPGGPVAAAPGDTWNFSAWFRDATPMGAPTSNFADAVQVTFD